MLACVCARRPLYLDTLITDGECCAVFVLSTVRRKIRGSKRYSPTVRGCMRGLAALVWTVRETRRTGWGSCGNSFPERRSEDDSPHCLASEKQSPLCIGAMSVNRGSRRSSPHCLAVGGRLAALVGQFGKAGEARSLSSVGGRLAALVWTVRVELAALLGGRRTTRRTDW